LLANSLTAYLGCPVAFIGVAAGSTALSQWQSGQTLNTRMLNYINAAASDGLEGICSWIGESDAGNATSETDFKTRYNAVIDQLKSVTGVNCMLVAISGLALTDYANVRQWIKDIAASNANASNTVPEIWPLYQKIHYETDTETALAANAVGNGLINSFYSDSVTASVNYDLGAFGFGVSASNSAPLVSADATYSIGDFGFDVAADNMAPSGGATVSFSIGDFGFSVDASSSVPVFSADAVFDLGDFGFAVVASIASNNESAYVAFDLGSFGFAASASVINPPITATTAFDMGSFGFSVFATQPSEAAPQDGASITFTEKSRTIRLTENSRTIKF
jgi:hypothetical protein